MFGWVLLNHSIIENFDGSIFFKYILPQLIFSSGYNLRKEKFFSNVLMILLNSVLGTFVNFILILLFMQMVNNLGLVVTASSRTVRMEESNLVLFSLAICAQDSLSAISIIKPSTQPDLFSVLLGDNLLNNAFSIIAFESTERVLGGRSTAIGNSSLQKYGLVAVQLLENITVSLLIGLAASILAILLVAHFRQLSHSAIIENCIVLLFGYLSYLCASIINYSGFVAVLVCGSMMAHYMVYNLTPTGRITSQITVQSISDLSQSFLYIYLGITFWWMIFGSGFEKKKNYEYISFSFIGLTLLAVTVSRTITIFLISLVTKLLRKKKFVLTSNQIVIIWYSGLIRGAIACSLIYRIPQTCDKSDEACFAQNLILKSSIMIVIILTTSLIGAFLPFVINSQIQKSN